MFQPKPSQSFISPSVENYSGISGSSEFSESLDRRSPFAQSEFVLGVTTVSSFEIPYTFLTPSSTDTIYALVINSNGPIQVWRDPSVTQVRGALRLKGSSTVQADFLLFIP